mgnify:CR=1 FL=1
MRKLFILLLVGTLICTTSCTRAFHAWNAERVGDIDEMYKVQNADNRLYNYQWFFEQYNQISATANNVKVLTGDERTGTLMVLNSMIAEYNSKASQTRNAAKFKSDSLPYRIEISDFGL